MGKLQLQQVGKAYGKRPAVLQDISMHINDGEFVVILGPSGCGKSTLLRLICGLDDVSSGVIAIDAAARSIARSGDMDGARAVLDKALTVHSALVARRQTEVNLQQNEQVKKISSWAAIIFAPTLIGTVYGMNFDNMPELHWKYGYLLILALMGGVCFGLYRAFRKSGWL